MCLSQASHRLVSLLHEERLIGYQTLSVDRPSLAFISTCRSQSSLSLPLANARPWQLHTILEVRKAGEIFHPQHCQAAVVLLVCHHPGLLQHPLCGRGTLPPTPLVIRVPLLHRIHLFGSVSHRDGGANVRPRPTHLFRVLLQPLRLHCHPGQRLRSVLDQLSGTGGLLRPLRPPCPAPASDLQSNQILVFPTQPCHIPP